MRGYDAWKTTDPADNELGRSNGKPSPWHCTVCEAHGRGVMAQAAHWRLTGHMMRFGKKPSLVSLCAWCPDSQERTAALKRLGRDVTHGICPKHKRELEAGR